MVSGFPGGASGEESTCQGRRFRRRGFNPWVRKIPWHRRWQPTSAFLSGKFHGQRRLAGYSQRGCKRVRHNWATERAHAHTHTHTHTPDAFRLRHLFSVYYLPHCASCGHPPWEKQNQGVTSLPRGTLVQHKSYLLLLSWVGWSLLRRFSQHTCAWSHLLLSCPTPLSFHLSLKIDIFKFLVYVHSEPVWDSWHPETLPKLFQISYPDLLKF